MTAASKSFSPWSLGAPLYMPAHRRDLMDCANGEKLSQLRAMIFCTEDAISEADVEISLRHLGLCLQGFKDTPYRYRFIRARNPAVLERLLALPHIENIDGFVLPKFNAGVLHAYLDQLQGTPFKIMPTLETKDVFDVSAMIELRQALLQHPLFGQIVMLRIGGNDLMSLLGIRRHRNLTLYETPMGHVISQLVTLFKPHGFSVAAPVFEYLDDVATLKREINQDLAHGLIGKTAIHPVQIPVIETAYRVAREDYDMAIKLVDQSAPAVFKMHNAMCEVATHLNWALDILKRQQYYGIREVLSTNECIELPCM
jgi:citrate lyase beta subunit